MASKIISIRGHFYEADDSEFHIYPYFPMLAFIATAVRSLYRRVCFFFHSLLLTLFVVCFSRSSRLQLLKRLHTTDAVEAIKND